ncbi:MAG: metallopeptidase family protein [Dehalococcoidales bacterium]|jgi:predicted Zn-dependent protease with MMP-like domain|nr:metallopeptidase family protein [Dehalococcoidales bacterium]
MDQERFGQLVVQAIERLPDEFHARLENIDVVVEARPTARQLAETELGHDETLLGLYEGVPLTQRSPYYGLVVPDKITIFQKPIEVICKNDTEIRNEICRVVQHEIAHHFGIGDTRLSQLEMDED